MKNRLAAAAAAAALIALCFSAGAAVEAGQNALRLCAETILPSLFPFFVLSILLSRLGLPQRLGARFGRLSKRLFGVSGAGAAALPIGLLGGYPLGAACVSELLSRSAITRKEAEDLLLFCNNSGPAFLIGAVGTGIFSSRRAGFLLYGAHTAAAVLTGILFRTAAPAAPPPEPAEAESPAAALPAAIRQAVSAVLAVCGFVVCFSVLQGLFAAWGLFELPVFRSQTVRAVFAGLFEIGSAVGQMRALPLCPQSLALAAGVIGWGGLSVHCQTAALFCEQEISLRRHTLGRLCSALFSAAFAWGFAALALRG